MTTFSDSRPPFTLAGSTESSMCRLAFLSADSDPVPVTVARIHWPRWKIFLRSISSSLSSSSSFFVSSWSSFSILSFRRVDTPVMGTYPVRLLGRATATSLLVIPVTRPRTVLPTLRLL